MDFLRIMAKEIDPAAYAALSARYPPPPDIYDPVYGVKIGFVDRSTRCHTKRKHSSIPTARCHVAFGDLYIKCLAPECVDAPAFRLGPL
jgi:hypothetical protein